VPHPCPIVREALGNNGRQRAPLITTASDRIDWSEAVRLRGGCGI
jgi:hypothetical protein